MIPLSYRAISFSIAWVLIFILFGCENKNFSVEKTTAIKPEVTKKNPPPPLPLKKPVPEKPESPFTFATLKDWTKEVLIWDESRVPSPVQNAQYRDKLTINRIEVKEFLSALALCAQAFTTGAIISADHWLGKKSPSENFYDVKSFGSEIPSGIDAESIYFGQKIIIPKESSIVVMGDFHGSIHSLIRNLWRLHNFGYLDNDFKITKKDTYFIFTGDFVDRGRYSIETLYTLLRLKLANFDNVFLLRGNHENKAISLNNGLLTELEAKYDAGIANNLFTDITDFYRFLPAVLFVGIDQDTTTNFLHFSHGGFSYDADKKKLNHSPAPLLALNKNPSYELIPAAHAQGYMWSDFHQDDQTINSKRGFDINQGVSIIGKNALEQYFDETGKKVVAIFRGHQDQAFGLKLLFKNSPSPEKLAYLEKSNPQYPDGPYYWKYVATAYAVGNARNIGINIADYRPVLTFTTAAEGQAVPFDAYGIIKPSGSTIRLLVHESSLSARVLDRSYVTIAPSSSPKDNISVTWSIDGPGKLMVP